MATLDELKKEYNVNEFGIITNPGKFESEPLATPFYYDLMLNGEGNCIKIEPDDRLAFELPGWANYVLVCEDGQGFVGLKFLASDDEAEEFGGWDFCGLGLDERCIDNDELDDEGDWDEHCLEEGW